jgi:hypothetical protein
MRCYFLCGGQIVGVEMLPPGLSEQDAIARAHTLSSKRRGRIDGFEVWDSARLVIRHLACADGAVNEAAAFGQPLPSALARLAAARQANDDIAVALPRPA